MTPVVSGCPFSCLHNYHSKVSLSAVSDRLKRRYLCYNGDSGFKYLFILFILPQRRLPWRPIAAVDGGFLCC